MTDEHRNETEANRHHGACGLRRGARFGIVAGVLLLVGAIAGGLATMAFNASANGWSRGWGHHGGVWNVDEIKERATHHVSWWLETVDATAEQEREAADVIEGLIERVYPLAQEHRANRQAVVSALTQTEIDRGALESIRRAELELADTVSTEVVAALSDVADILSVEQRERLAGKLRGHRH